MRTIPEPITRTRILLDKRLVEELLEINETEIVAFGNLPRGLGRQNGSQRTISTPGNFFRVDETSISRFPAYFSSVILPDFAW